MFEFNEIKTLFSVKESSHGFSEEEMIECEKYLGKRLPEVLRQYYLQLGKNKEINQTQDNLALPNELEFSEDGFVIIYIENQVVWEAGIKFSEFEAENPNVFLSYDQKNWDFEIGNLYNFLTAEAFLQALFALPFNANSCDVGKEKELFIRQNWKESDFKSYLWGTDFFQNSADEIVAIMKSENQIDVFIGANNEAKFLETDKTLNIEWDYNSIKDR